MKFSIITITKNNLNGLLNTYSSILNQSFKDYEWIVIDGDSTDGTKEWLIKNKSNIKFLSEPDTGIYNAMNKGIDLAKGTFFLFLNASDLFFNQETLDKINDKITDQTYFIYGDSVDFNNNQEFLRKSKSHKDFWFRMFTHHQSMFFRNFNNFKIHYNEKYLYSSDYDLITKIFSKYLLDKNIVKVQFPISKFELGGEHQINRLKAMKEDFLIRKDNLSTNIFLNIIVYLSHLIHYYIKYYIPKIHQNFRYEKHEKK